MHIYTYTSQLRLHVLSNCAGAWQFNNDTCSHSVLHHTKYNLFIETLIETHREKGSLLESLFLWLFYCLLNIDICILLKTLTNDKPNGINVQRFEDPQVGYTSNQKSLGPYTLEKYTQPIFSLNWTRTIFLLDKTIRKLSPIKYYLKLYRGL